jgi:hypothetical protein
MDRIKICRDQFSNVSRKYETLLDRMLDLHVNNNCKK